MKIFTIGFTKKSARRFFELLRTSGARRVVDVRLNNVSQLAGFAKRDDLAYFLGAIGGMDYVHVPALAPTKQMLDAYKKQRGDWSTYETRFLDLMRARRVEQTVPRESSRTAACCAARTPPTIVIAVSSRSTWTGTGAEVHFVDKSEPSVS